MASYNPKFSLLFFIYTTFLALLIYYSNSETPVHVQQLDKHLSDDEVVQLFNDWKKEHGRIYTENEEMTKFDIFKSNLKYITDSNERGNTLGLNKFSDLSEKEFKQTYLNCLDTIDTDMLTDNVTTELNVLPQNAPPPSLDWRVKGAVTDVKNQGSCSCCWAFSAIGGIEGINAIDTKKLISLSPQELVDCIPPDERYKSGTISRALKWVIKNGGVASEAAYPFNGKLGDCQSSKVAISAGITSYVKLEKTEDALLNAVAIQPISVGVDATEMRYYNKDSGVYEGKGCQPSTTITNHALLIVGYGRTKEGVDYWIAKNSWGKNWGKDGYIWIKRNSGLPYGVCGINGRAFRPIKTKK